MKSHLLRLFLVNLSLVAAIGLRADPTTINFTSEAFQSGQTSVGADLTSSFTFSMGSFGSFIPTAGNVGSWVDNFTALGTTFAWDEGWGYYSGASTLTNNDAPFSTADQGYVWGYNYQTVGPTTEWILLTNPSWKFPMAGSGATVDWTSTDAGTVAVWGALNVINNVPYIQTAAVSAVPEPSTYALIGGLAMLGFVWFRRHRARV